VRVDQQGENASPCGYVLEGIYDDLVVGRGVDVGVYEKVADDVEKFRCDEAVRDNVCLEDGHIDPTDVAASLFFGLLRCPGFVSARYLSGVQPINKDIECERLEVFNDDLCPLRLLSSILGALCGNTTSGIGGFSDVPGMLYAVGRSRS
jgi:hypothetical protein